ncbi:MAG: IPExxxVDY family protein [Bacteroidales bacterium]|nr:IPExxxVDY family protein [Bacteroidales bacterium]
MVKKRTLNLSYVPEFSVLGIFTTQKDYRFCWFLNRRLKLDLKRLPAFSYTPYKQESPAAFTVFHHYNERLRQQYYLLGNKSAEGVLFELPKNLDFLMLVRNGAVREDLPLLVEHIRKTPMVQGAYLLDDAFSKRTYDVLYDFEMYLATC